MCTGFLQSWIIAGLAIIAAAGCQAPPAVEPDAGLAERWEAVEVGMSSEAVEGLLGTADESEMVEGEASVVVTPTAKPPSGHYCTTLQVATLEQEAKQRWVYREGGWTGEVMLDERGVVVGKR